MRKAFITLSAGATLFAGAMLLAPASAAAQDLAGRVNAAPADATIRFTFESKPGVCGDGENIRVRSVSAGGTITGDQTIRSRSDWMGECLEGPVEVTIERTGRRVSDADVRVGGAPRAADVDLGDVATTDAVAFLLSGDVLRTTSESADDEMIFAATLAAAEIWPGLLRVARMQDLASGTRKSAVFWLAQAAGAKATEGLRCIVGDDSDEMEVRKQAIFALSQIRSDETIDALIEIARSNREPELRKNAMFWLGQSGDDRAIAFFEEILRG
ncbi:MAG TPA: HEAT repeat domain-containing protein [Longimicrobiales bacterium]|nr:HEAT repeat domain-containing protein [Longimicrobiales bacterium]